MRKHIVKHIDSVASLEIASGASLTFTREQISKFSEGTFTESVTGYWLTIAGSATTSGTSEKVEWRIELPKVVISEVEDTFRSIMKFIEDDRYVHSHGHRELEASFLKDGLTIGFARTDSGFWAFVRAYQSRSVAEARFTDYPHLLSVYHAYKKIIN